MEHSPLSVAMPRAPAVAERVPSSAKVLPFGLHQQAYAVRLLRVREIISYSTPTELPMMPRFVRGVINLRGSAVPLVDLALRLGGSATKLRPRTAILIVEVGAHSVGVLVDAVHAVLDLEAAELESAPSIGGSLRREFVRGMTHVDDGGFVVVLDLDAVFRPGELDAISDVGDRADVLARGARPRTEDGSAAAPASAFRTMANMADRRGILAEMAIAQ